MGDFFDFMEENTKTEFKLQRGLVLHYFWEVVRNYKVSFFAMFISLTIPYVLDIFIPLQYLRLWNVISDKSIVDVSHAHNILFQILFLHLCRWLFRRAGDFINDYFTANAMADLRKQAFSYMIGHSLEFFANNFAGSLVQKINKYARAFEKLLQKFLSDVLPIVIRSTGFFLSIYLILPKYAYMIGIFCAVFLLIGIIFSKYKLKYDVISALKDSKTVGALADSIGNHSTIQFFTGHSYERKHVGDIINEQRQATLTNWYLWDLIFSIQSLLCIAVEICIFYFAINDWKLGLIGLPVFILMQSYLTNLIGSLWNWAGVVRTYYEGFSDAQEMAIILNTPYGVIDYVTKTLPKDVNGNISFNNVTYIYKNNNTKVFDNFSLEIPSGQKVALVGSSGAGKSTFVKLLMRLFDINSGEILIDGLDIKNVSQEDLREKIAFVPQDPSLFHRTLLENIRYGKRGASDEEVKRAAMLAHCDDFIDRLPNGYETYVGERGIKLSGGERQRVAIARAILKNAPILILDEATSALDSHSEMLIQDALHTLIEGKTTIVVAHRLSTIRVMDRIIVIENGKIVEDGTHQELLDNNSGLYKKLWDIQAGGFDADL